MRGFLIWMQCFSLLKFFGILFTIEIKGFLAPR